MMVVFKTRDSVPIPRYSPVCNVLRQWKSSLIPTYRVYDSMICNVLRQWEMAIFYFARRAPKLRYYGDVIHSFYWKSAVEHDGGVLKCVIVYLSRDIRSLVMYCVNGKLAHPYL